MNLGVLLVRAPRRLAPPPIFVLRPRRSTPTPILGEDLVAGDLLGRASGAETPPPIPGEESCSRKVSGDAARIDSLRIRENKR